MTVIKIMVVQDLAGKSQHMQREYYFCFITLETMENANSLSAKSLLLIFFKFILFGHLSHYSSVLKDSERCKSAALKFHINCDRILVD